MNEKRIECNAWNLNWRTGPLNTAAKTGDWAEFRRLWKDIKEFVEAIDAELNKEEN